MHNTPDIAFHTLGNGLRLASERLPGARSVSFGIWLAAGSRHEAPGEEGIAHLWEHLAFKGTARRSALDIAKALDLLGGNSNAYTSREHTCFHARVVDTHLEDALDILSDIVLNPRLDQDDLAKEKDVVLQEIAMVEDDPEESLMEAFWGQLWPGGSLAHSILGAPGNVKSFKPKNLKAWRAAHYRPGRMILAAAGGVEHSRIQALVERHFGGMEPGSPAPVPEPGLYVPNVYLKEREAEQNHVALSFPGMAASDERRFTLSVLNAILGGNMSSRLFQEVRERRGLAYSVYSFANALMDRGVMQVYAAVDPERTGELLACLREQLEKLAGGDITAEELDHARDHLISVLYLSLESSEDRMTRLARNFMLFGRSVPPEETAGRIEAVTLEDVRALAGELFTLDKAGLGILGPVIDPKWADILKP